MRAITNPPASVIVRNFDLERVAILALEADAPLLVDPDAVLALAVPFEVRLPVDAASIPAVDDIVVSACRAAPKSLVHDAIASGFDQIRREYKVPVSALVATEAELRSPKLESAVTETRRDGLLLFGTTPVELRGVRVLNADARKTK